jgi:uncharacterized protein (TIGR03067 family)
MGDESQPNHEVFISYSSKDKKWADATCAVLERHRIRCWIAPRDITPGTEWGAAIIHGMDASKIMVLIFSGHANESAQVRREVERAISKGLVVLPFRVENISPAGAMEYALSNTHWLDGFTKPVERQFELLASSVAALLAKSGGEVAERPVVAASPVAGTVDRRQKAGGIAAVLLILVAGLFVMFRGRSSELTTAALDPSPTGKEQTKGNGTAQRSDEDRIQGRWQVVEQDSLKKQFSSDELENLKPAWTFHDTHLAIHQLVDGAEVLQHRGSFSLRPAGRHKLFDFNGVRLPPAQEPQQMEWRGIYEFDGEFLRICYRWRRLPDGPVVDRPDSFKAVRGPGGTNSLKLRRVGD